MLTCLVHSDFRSKFALDRNRGLLAAALGADSLRYLPVESIARAIGYGGDELCQACITGEYPTPCGQRLYQIALENAERKVGSRRTYEGETVHGGAAR